MVLKRAQEHIKEHLSPIFQRLMLRDLTWIKHQMASWSTTVGLLYTTSEFINIKVYEFYNRTSSCTF